MAAPGILTGSSKKTQLFRSTSSGAQVRSNQGVFGDNPGATPKYAFNKGARDAEYKESMARLFIEIPPGEVESFLNSLPEETRPLAQVLISGQDVGGAGGTGFIDFLLTQAQEPMKEKAQIVDTLTDNYVAFYSGQSPMLFRYSGHLLNTYQDDQRVWFLRLYRDILRGTRLANRNLIARLRYDSFIVSGYLENLNLSIEGRTDHQAGRFRFGLRVKRLSVFTPSLAHPTVAETPATTNSIIQLPVTEIEGDPNTRIATISPETPLEALAGPAAEAVEGAIGDPSRQEEVRKQLLSEGFSDAQINGLYQQVRDKGPIILEDPREQQLRKEQEHEARMQAITQNLEQVAAGGQGASAGSVPLNPENSSNDGTGGLTNVLGTGLEAATGSVGGSLKRIISGRSRGRDRS